jgi:hypothetical protein
MRLKAVACNAAEKVIDNVGEAIGMTKLSLMLKTFLDVRQ